RFAADEPGAAEMWGGNVPWASVPPASRTHTCTCRAPGGEQENCPLTSTALPPAESELLATPRLRPPDPPPAVAPAVAASTTPTETSVSVRRVSLIPGTGGRRSRSSERPPPS